MRRVLLVILVLVVIIIAVGLFMAGSQGLLPWQPEPTRIPITPFADLQSGGSTGTPVP